MFRTNHMLLQEYTHPHITGRWNSFQLVFNVSPRFHQTFIRLSSGSSDISDQGDTSATMHLKLVNYQKKKQKQNKTKPLRLCKVDFISEASKAFFLQITQMCILLCLRNF